MLNLQVTTVARFAPALWIAACVAGFAHAEEVSPHGLVNPVAPIEIEDAPHPGFGCSDHQIARPQDQLFLISVRECETVDDACECADPRCSRFEVSESGRDGVWREIPIDAFYATDDSQVATVVHIHGNRIAPGEDVGRGLMTYRSLVRHARSDAPIRFVIFSWPSSKIVGPLRDFRVKAQGADIAAQRLAAVLARLAPDAPVSLIGYSYGARVASGALHLLAGGTLDGFAMPDRPAPSRRAIRTVFFAAAIDNDWLLPNRRLGLAMTQIDRLLLVNNSIDPVNKRYYLIRPHDHPSALGYAGFACLEPLGPLAGRVEQIDARFDVGRHHALPDFLAAPRLTQRAWQYASFQEVLSK